MNSKRRATYGFPSFPTVDKAIAFGSLNPAANASSNHLRNCKIENGRLRIQQNNFPVIVKDQEQRLGVGKTLNSYLLTVMLSTQASKGKNT